MNRNYNICKVTSRSYWCILFVVASLMACKKNDWFDIKSDKNLSVPATLQDFELLLDNYNVMSIQSPGLGEVGSDGHFVPDEIYKIITNSISSNPQFNAYTWNHNLPYEQVLDWNASYQRIFQCNLVLDGLKKFIPRSAIEIEQYNLVKGNALFHRAKTNFDLAQVYAQPYNSATAKTDFGIPLKNGIDVTESARRSTVHETYNQILNDLQEASAILPDVPKLRTRGSRPACQALLARTYLVMQDFTKALESANSTLSINSALMDFNLISPSAVNLGMFNTETIFHSEMAVLIFIYHPQANRVDPELYALYGEHDLRKTRFFKLDPTGIIFKGMYNNGIAQFSGLATDEMYLIRAECYARSNRIAEALADLNHLLKSRWDSQVNYQAINAGSANEVLDLVLIERKKELLLRGIRWSDLRRLNLEERFKTNLTRTVGGKTYTLEANSNKYTLPIPDDVMKLAPMMQQSPGW